MQNQRAIPLPRGWTDTVKSAALHAVALAHEAFVRACGAASQGHAAPGPLAIENQRLRTELAQLREEQRIKDEQMRWIPPWQRPHYRPTERMAILELKAARGWSLAQTAERLLVTSA